MRPSVVAIVQALVDCTPAPEDADPSLIIERAGEIAAVRETLLAELRAALAGGASLDGCAALAATLDERDRRWVAALERARILLGERLRGTRRLRYAY